MRFRFSKFSAHDVRVTLGTDAAYSSEVPMSACKVLISFEGPDATQTFEPVSPQTPFTADQSVMPVDKIAEALDNTFSPKQTVASVENGAASDGPIARLFRRFLIVHVAQQSGRSEADVREAVAKVEVSSGRPILDWLTGGGLKSLIALILEILGGLGALSAAA